MSGDVNDPPLPLEQRVDHRTRIRPHLLLIVRADQASDAVTGKAAGGAELGLDSERFFTRARKPRVLRRIAVGLPDDEHAGIGARVPHLTAKICRAKLPEQLGAEGPRPDIAAAGDRGIEQLPGDGGRAPVELDLELGRAGEVRFHLLRHQQLEEGVPDTGVGIPVVRGFLHQVPQQCALHGLGADLGAGAARVERVRDLLLALWTILRNRGDEVVLGAAISRVDRTRQCAGP